MIYLLFVDTYSGSEGCAGFAYIKFIASMTSYYINKIFAFTWHIIFDIKTKVIKFKAFSFVQMVACAA